MSTNPPTHEQTTALAAMVRDNTLTREQCEQTAVVLGMVGSAIRVAAQVIERADDPAAAAASVAGAWQPIAIEYSRLLAGTTGG